ncbi:helix-turn-helix transcriptional regulator [Brevibacillus agri]|uniref:helix-turn-helix transcriptional regulator n=1 Tax=Brevibacillus agri TaxID=51101 RepID=UPI001EE510C8|nr:helix-turn-helix transcriptional regulator [Brevibacillus agri]MCG5251365.1 helix-turn-helix domain-containing protein [Brevibacillus agri]
MPIQTINDAQLLILASMSMGQRIRFIREIMCSLFGKEKYTTKTLANQLEVTPQTLTAIERGDSRNPSFNVVYGLAKAFNVKVEVFTDEYYQAKPIKPFTVGFVDEDEVIDVDWENDDLEDDSSSEIPEGQCRLGLYITQHFDNGETRIVTSHLTNNNINPVRLVETLCRITMELQILDQSSMDKKHVQFSDLKDNPYNLAVRRYHSLLTEPEEFPLGQTEYWNNLIRQFNEHARHYQKQKEVQ